jgi:TPR repeat protein
MRYFAAAAAALAFVGLTLDGLTSAAAQLAGPSFKDDRRLPGGDTAPDEDEARRLAEEEARAIAAEADARRKAAEEARRLAIETETRRRAEDMARRAAAEADATRKADDAADRKAEAEARRAAEEEARKVAAEAEAKLKAEEDGRRAAAEAEARRKSEEEARRLAAQHARQTAAAIAAEAAAEARREEEARRLAPQAGARSAAIPEAASPDVARHLARGLQFLKDRDIASARLLLERAADGGSAEAALELAQTYDPALLPSLGVVGVVPDLEQARTWYRKAQELGSPAVAKRLQRLGGR